MTSQTDLHERCGFQATDQTASGRVKDKRGPESGGRKPRSYLWRVSLT